jgi:hypothetical protein
MAYKIGKVEVWAGDMMNRPGMLARVLEALSNAGADLEFVVARRVTANTSRAFVAPLTSAAQRRAAGDVGLVRTSGMHTLRIEGPDRAGLGARLTRALADAGINMRGLSSAAVARKSVCYIAFATAEEAGQAGKILKKALSRE